MGTTYHAHVETFVDARPEWGTVDRWEGLSLWELGKDYGFSAAWSEVCTDGWPPDHAPIVGASAQEHSNKYLYYEGRRWGDGELFRLVNYEDESPWFCELRSHVLSLVGRGFKVRVLTWDC